MTTLQAKKFKNRQDLEEFIKAEVGQNIKENREQGHEIKGKRKELKQLFLNDTQSVYGIKVVITDRPTAQILEEKRLKPKKK